jgi:hypothetical protein
MKGYRPSHFAQEANPELVQQMQMMDPRRVRRIVVYMERVRDGLPLFDDPVDVPVRHLRNHQSRAKAG